jgi:hypothetical protein
MKIKSNYVLRQVADIWIVLPLAEENLNLNGMLTVTESGAMLWKILERGSNLQTLVNALTDEYEVTEEQSRADVIKFVEKLKQIGCLEPD